MSDQASALRQLKKRFDEKVAEPLPAPEVYLASLPRPTPFPTTLLVIPDKIGSQFPPLHDWLPALIRPGSRACLWDQGGFLSARTPALSALESLEGEQGLPIRQTVEWATGPMWLIPRSTQFGTVPFSPEQDRMRFSKHLYQGLGTIGELWITLSQSDLSSSGAILHATDLAMILVPQNNESILRCYETVKALHLAGYFSPIMLLIESSEGDPTGQLIFQRIQGVAQQFLSLDLLPAGVILSGDRLPDPETVLRIRSALESIDPSSRQFMHAFSERLLYPGPKDGMPRHV